jgi:hypothetical protein
MIITNTNKWAECHSWANHKGHDALPADFGHQNLAMFFPKAWRQGRFLRPVRGVAARILAAVLADVNRIATRVKLP